MKKALFSAFFIAVAAFADNVANQTLFGVVQSGTAQTATQSQNAHNVIDLGETSQHNIIDLSSQPRSYEVFSKSGVELGIGYVRANFTAMQTLSYLSGTTTGAGNGVDFFTRYNHYFTERFGVNLGMGLEFMNVKWQDALLDYSYSSYGWMLENIDSDNVLSWYFNIGLFVDAFKSDTMAVRLFGNVGYGAHWFFGGFYYKDDLEGGSYSYDL